VLLFGEILPSALFSGPKQLRIAAKLSGLVWGLIYLLAPIAMPLAWLLDRFVGPHNHRKRYRHTHRARSS
jgi:metal transporter CNNM